MNLGGFVAQRTIGRGGSAVVYEGRGPAGERVAIKVLLRARLAEPERFDRERRLLEALGAAEGFVPLFASGDSPAGPFLVMEFMEGGTLRDRLMRGARMTPEEVVALGRALATAIGRAHERGIVHRDLKPENILFTSDPPRPLIADLGLAKHFRKDAPGASRSLSLSGQGELRGTAGYMAPEQATEAREAGPAADVFSLGAILYECLTGVPAFNAETLVALLSKVESGEHEPLRALAPEAPRALARAIERALDPDPARRFADGHAFARALEAALAPPRSRGALVAGVALAGVLLAGGGALLARGRALAPPAPPPAAPPPPPASPPPPSLDLVLVPAGPFTMGVDDEAREVRLAAFQIAPRTVERRFATRAEILAFCATQQARLPTEAEWEKAMRKGAIAPGARPELVLDGWDGAAAAELPRRDPYRPVERGLGLLRTPGSRIRIAADAPHGDVAFRLVRSVEPVVAGITFDSPSANAPPCEGEHVRVSGRIDGAVREVTVNGARARFRGYGRFEANVGPNAREAVVAAVSLDGVRVEARLPFTRRHGTPPWLGGLSPGLRPSVPLPEGLVFSGRRERYQNAKDGSELVYVAKGAFFVGLHDVTNEQFEVFVAETGYRTEVERGVTQVSLLNPEGADDGTGNAWGYSPKTWRDLALGPDYPVVGVSHADATAYVQWAGLRLPTAAEWEEAALRDPVSDSVRKHPWGDELLPGRVANLCDATFRSAHPRWTRPSYEGYADGYETISPVGAFPRGAAPCGALDMFGCVWQWCEDGPPETGDGPRRFVRGPAWDSPPVAGAGSVDPRGTVGPFYASGAVGFRVAR